MLFIFSVLGNKQGRIKLAMGEITNPGASETVYLCKRRVERASKGGQQVTHRSVLLSLTLFRWSRCLHTYPSQTN